MKSANTIKNSLTLAKRMIVSTLWGGVIPNQEHRTTTPRVTKLLANALTVILLMSLTINLQGQTFFTNPVYMNRSTTVAGTHILYVDGKSTFNNDVLMNTNLNVNSNFLAGGTGPILGSFTAANNVTFPGLITTGAPYYPLIADATSGQLFKTTTMSLVPNAGTSGNMLIDNGIAWISSNNTKFDLGLNRFEVGSSLPLLGSGLARTLTTGGSLVYQKTFGSYPGRGLGSNWSSTGYITSYNQLTQPSAYTSLVNNNSFNFVGTNTEFDDYGMWSGLVDRSASAIKDATISWGGPVGVMAPRFIFSYQDNNPGATPIEIFTLAKSGKIGVNIPVPAFNTHISTPNGNPINLGFTNSSTGYTAGDGADLTLSGNGDLKIDMNESTTNFSLYQYTSLPGASALYERYRMQNTNGFTAIATGSEVVPTGGATAQLHILGSDFTQIKITNAASGTTSTDGFNIGLSGTSASSPSTYLKALEPDFPITFHTNNGGAGVSEKIRVTKEGYLAINTTTTPNYLGINGNASIGSTFATTGAPTNGLMVEGQVAIENKSLAAGTYFYSLSIDGKVYDTKTMVIVQN